MTSTPSRTGTPRRPEDGPEGVCPASELGALVADPDPRTRHRGLTLLAERANGPLLSRAEEARLAGLLPSAIPESPDESLLLARLHQRLGSHLPRKRLTRWRGVRMPEQVRIAWLTAEILTHPSVLEEEHPGELLNQAVRGIDGGSAARPDRLLTLLAGTGVPFLRREAVRLIRQGLRAGTLAPDRARARLAGLLDNPDDTPAASAALAELAEPWAASDPLPATCLAPYLAPSRPAPLAVQALATAARHGHAALLREAAADTAVPPAVRRRAVELLAGLAGRSDIGALLDLATRDPLLLGAPLMTCLQGLHRRGHFPGPSHAPAVVALALDDHSIDPVTVATILYTVRRATLDVLVDAPADDPSMPRRLALLVALAAQGTGDLPVGQAITRLLPSARLPAPFLDALRELRHEEAEEAVLALLPTVPAAALHTLEAIGGERTVETLTAALGPETDGSMIAPCLRPVRREALELLWRLNTDPGLRRHILARVDPMELPPAVAAGLGDPDEREIALLTASAEHVDPAAGLRALAALGTASVLPTVTALLSRAADEAAILWETVETARVPKPDEAREPTLPGEVVDAVRGLGARLYERRAIRPVCLLDVGDAREAGDALLAWTVLGLVEAGGVPSRRRAVLLETLRHAPSARIRHRIHRLLRDRDPQVRKQVISLLASGGSGVDARALSASLIPLTRADDIQTVRQALLALGRAEARWACPAVTALLDHPNMNIRKTAASVLETAGTPAAVPGLLRGLGRHDNPGLRAGMVAALGAILGEARTATVLAAAVHRQDSRERALLLRALDGTLTARTVLALADQGSPLVRDLLVLIADRRIRLGAGRTADLAELSGEYGITVSVGHAFAEDAEACAAALVDDGWSDRTALRLADDPSALRPARLRALRPMLPDWLRLARTAPEAARHSVLGLLLQLYPAPWQPFELDLFAGSARTLTRCLDGREEYHSALLRLLEAVAPRLPGTERTAVAAAVRGMSPPPAVRGLRVLKACGVVPVRADLDRALRAARSASDARQACAEVLSEAFGTPGPPTGDSRAEAWRAALNSALGDVRALERLRYHEHRPPASRRRLSALMAAHPDAGSDEVRDFLVDWMTDLQPLGVPPWNLGEAPGPAPETVHTPGAELPRSAARRAELLETLEAPDRVRREAAAAELASWREPEAARAVLDAYLRGRIDRPGEGAVRTLATTDPADLRSAGTQALRVAGLARRLGPWELVAFVPLLLDWWEHGPADLRTEAGHALRSVPVDVLAEHLGDRLDAGAWGLLDLLAGRGPYDSPRMRRTRERLRTEGRHDLADTLLPGGTPAPACPATDSVPARTLRPGRAELLRLACTGGPEQIRRALSRLAEEHDGREPDRDPALGEVIGALLTHPRPRIRLHAHRTSRTMLDRRSHLAHTTTLLDDPQPDIVRMAIRTLCRAVWEPALPTLVALLEHSHPAVREEAAKGLLGVGDAAVPAVRHAAGRARPDRRSRYTAVLERMAG
ncbi:HEAT repeat domain-containing protein [Streptomyces sp. NPDC048301]|uniref:HEAT repeat domain-containing protein n=1 Tax=unclassified Streptomyces TaxID=2593676 RepID=UPI00342B29BE